MSLWSICTCGALTAESLLRDMPVRRCNACGSASLKPADPHQSGLADVGAVRITRLVHGKDKRS